MDTHQIGQFLGGAIGGAAFGFVAAKVIGAVLGKGSPLRWESDPKRSAMLWAAFGMFANLR